MSFHEIELVRNKNKRIAIIYSLDDLFVYIIKICHKDGSYYIGKDDQPEKFGNIDDAKMACRSQHAEEAYLALSSTYQEVDSTTEILYRPVPRFEYQKIPL